MIEGANTSGVESQLPRNDGAAKTSHSCQAAITINVGNIILEYGMIVVENGAIQDEITDIMCVFRCPRNTAAVIKID
jgi:hypothetical protein